MPLAGVSALNLPVLWSCWLAINWLDRQSASGA